MDDLLAARSQMAMALAFHIVFAVIGIGMPLLMVIAERRYLKTRDPVSLELARRWAKGTAIMFAVGAVSGTVLSFELSLLWPRFMELAGPIVGMPFSLEGFAFFLEAIFLGIYLYGWDKVPERTHLAAGVMVLICGTLSGIFVVAANAWMNAPTGYEVLADGSVEVDVWAAMFNDAMFAQTFHMTMAAFTSVGFAVAGIHAYALHRYGTTNPFHRQAYRIALTVGGLGSIMMLVSGDVAAKTVAELQPLKLAAMEAHWDTEAGADLIIGGIPDEEEEVTRWAIRIPGGLSFLAFGDFDAEVRGIKEWPRHERPPVAIVHYAFQIMVGCGFFMIGLALLAAFLALRNKTLPTQRWLLRLVIFATPLGFIATEAGWVVTEVGRQPWVIQGVMKTADALTPMPDLVVPFAAFTVLYLFLSVIVVMLLKRQVFATFPEALPEGDDASA